MANGKYSCCTRSVFSGDLLIILFVFVSYSRLLWAITVDCDRLAKARVYRSLMVNSDTRECNVGRYSGEIAKKYRDPRFLAELENIQDLVHGPDARIISSGRNLNVLISIAGQNVVVKSFGRQWVLKDLIDGFRGSKAKRTWRAATVLSSEGVGTPFPVAFLECWKSGRLVESYFISEHQDNALSFKDELLRLLKTDSECEKLMTLLETVATAVRKMHRAAGVRHNDLGNQNIMVLRDGMSAWKNVMFVDLNRATITNRLSVRAAARDISRIYLPSEMLRVFVDMYFGSAIPPRSFRKWERFYRRLYAVHCFTRSIRHPVRTMVHRAQRHSSSGQADEYPHEKDLWLWDERSGQAVSMLSSRDRHRYYSRFEAVKIGVRTMAAVPGIWSEYKSMLGTCWREPVSMKGRIGISIEPSPEKLDLELALLSKLGKIPVMMRLYHHKGRKQWDFAIGVLKKLSQKGYPVSAALVQDRASVIDIDKWADFVRYCVENLADFVQGIEVGHAINRVKWGIWETGDYGRMLKSIAELAVKYPNVLFHGPAVIDFEYHYLVSVLKELPQGFRFGALSHHLYVDRRGAPEMCQGMFSTLEKCVLARAIGRRSGVCADRLIISEVNWPLKGTGVYSPVGSPYESPEPRTTDPSVDEYEYGNYMIRYFLTTICSGMAERVFWWRLVARGYGLIDETDPELWSERASYAMLCYFLRMLGWSTFLRRDEECEKQNSELRAFRFETGSGREICVIYSVGGNIRFEIPYEYESVTDSFGVTARDDDDTIDVGGSPVYIYI